MGLPQVNTAKFSVDLPGCGKTVEYRPFFVKEQKILMQAAESEDPAQISTATSEMIKACTFEKLEVDDLTSTDVEFLLLKIRTKSVGEKSKVMLKCQDESCGEMTETEIDIDKIAPTGGTEKEQKIQLKDSIGVCFKVPTIGTLKKFMLVADGTAMGTITATMAAAIDYVYDADSVYPTSEQSPEEVIQFLESLSSEQFKKAQVAFDNFPRLVHEVEYTCKKCSKKNNIQLGGMGDFLG